MEDPFYYYADIRYIFRIWKRNRRVIKRWRRKRRKIKKYKKFSYKK